MAPSGVTIHPDLAYPSLLIAIEADGFKDHGRKKGWQGDMHRGNPLQNLGWIVLRFSWEDVTDRPDYVLDSMGSAPEHASTELVRAETQRQASDTLGSFQFQIQSSHPPFMAAKAPSWSAWRARATSPRAAWSCSRRT